MMINNGSIGLILLALIKLVFTQPAQEFKNTSNDAAASFPAVAYDQVKLLSLDTAFAAFSQEQLEQQGYLQPVAGGVSFVDSTGRPFHAHFSARILSTAEVKGLVKILRPLPALLLPEPRNLCMPVFRDALVFYHQQKPVAHIQLCFHCQESRFFPPVQDMNDFDVSERFEQLQKLCRKN